VGTGTHAALIATGCFGVSLPALKVAGAIADGLSSSGLPAPDVCAICAEDGSATDLGKHLQAVEFDVRMRRARAVIVGARRLEEGTLFASPAFEIATRARQAGVPAYAVTCENRLDSFDERILDLQTVIEANTLLALKDAGRKLAKLIAGAGGDGSRRR
jgi:glycerate kinase